MKIYFLMIIISLFIGTFVGTVFSNIIYEEKEMTKEDLIKEYYEIENAVMVSPHSIRKKIGEGDTGFVLVDLRSQQEYETEHIIGAVNIPAYITPDTSNYDDVDRIVNSFKTLKEENPEKDIIVYCYSAPCMTGRKIGKMLSENEIFVKHLGIGWNEWKYYWDLWNHDGETKVDPTDYVATGNEPGFLKIEAALETCGLGDFGC